MSFPWEFGAYGYQVSAHFVFETLGFVLGFRYYLYLRKNQVDVISQDNRMWILLGAALGAFLGSRLLGILENPIAFWESKRFWLYFYQNRTIVGGLLGGLFAVEFTKKLIGEKNSSGDLFTKPLILAMIIGRIGCFSMGVYENTYGIETSMPWGMDLGDGLMRHPLMIYEIIFLILLWLSINYIQKNYTYKSGMLFQWMMTFYFLFRFVIEYLKPDVRIFLGLSSIQIACILGLMYYYKLVFNPWRVGAKK
jgi:prolipoprotein diacylglyceryltransferase